MELIPEKVSFKISTTGVELSLSELDGLSISLGVKVIEQNKVLLRSAKIHFSLIAEMKCISSNFYEFKYGEFTILEDLGADDIEKYWATHKIHPDPGFYMISKSEKLHKLNAIYDPLKRLNLKHFLVTGNDSYYEIISPEYNYEIY
ncbi:MULTISPECIES: hypothetical protein [Pseudomonas]|uniref:hypothetical protein n=1 Tax=Pseudomonas TaxID=286 RepID=UPI00289D0C8E|nr:hypothetical protein [Pseudomonas sp.]